MRTRTGIAAVMCSMAVAWSVSAGDLTPPVGPVAPTHKTLTEVEPRTTVQSLAGDATASHIITQPGSYYLTGNIQGVLGKDGIRIAAAGVEIDLRGFELIGAAASSTNAVTGAGGNTRITIRNGRIRGWGGWAVLAGGEQHQALSLQVTGCGEGLLFGHLSRVEDCLFNANGSGAQVGDASSILRCIATNNTATGFGIDGGSLIDLCVSTGNGTGIFHASGTGSIITNNICKQNGQNGINVCAGCFIADNVCTFNGTATATGAGIHSRCGGNRIEGNMIESNDRGIVLVINTKEVVTRNTIKTQPLSIVNVTGNDVAPLGTAATATSPWANISN